ncbi:hypothetical protein NECAME_05917 [Necator americanus]|uniref:Uncharacterized protein n=1 Tax=Necator americanus TaxID=51031 RepID=W2TXE5_NECAM|nr:hypothetical protein NECAME_05917 [Necator americanus]ETN86513.1 hypothetical protein NECAME_05917 [Necator americanus]
MVAFDVGPSASPIRLQRRLWNVKEENKPCAEKYMVPPAHGDLTVSLGPYSSDLLVDGINAIDN